MPGRVLVTGGSGFVGTAVISELLARNYAVTAVAHRAPITAASGDLRTLPCDLFNPDALRQAMTGCDAVIHLVGIIMERRSRGVTFERMHVDATRSVLAAAEAAGIKRYVHMSALGSRIDAVSTYHKTKYRAEQLVRASALDWTIFRPSLIHGPKGEFMRMEAAWARKQKLPFLFMPYFGAGPLGLGGAGKLQPIYVNDVARAFVDALEKPKTIGEVYPLAGTQEVTWPEMHRIAATAIVGHPRLVVPVPVWVALIQSAVGVGKLAGFNRDQVIMSQENNTTDLSKFKAAFGWEPGAFEEIVKGYAAEMRQA
jgi:NADH dehydrogenase